MKIAIGCDHIATVMKDELVKILKTKKYEVLDAGTYDSTKTHYPIYGFEVGRLVAKKHADLGIVLCGTGVGITNAANKTKGVRCALVKDTTSTIVAKREYNANVIGVGVRIIGMGLIEEIVDTFINEQYLGENKEIINEIDNAIKNDNYDIHQFDSIIKDWENGKYNDGTKQDKVPLPKTWKTYK